MPHPWEHATKSGCFLPHFPKEIIMKNLPFLSNRNQWVFWETSIGNHGDKIPNSRGCTFFHQFREYSTLWFQSIHIQTTAALHGISYLHPICKIGLATFFFGFAHIVFMIATDFWWRFSQQNQSIDMFALKKIDICPISTPLQTSMPKETQGDNMPINIWLVVYLPLWKMWIRQLGWWNSQLNGNIKHVPVTTNQFSS